MQLHNRHRPTNDSAPYQDGDTHWLGVNMRLHPSQLPPGIAAYAENMRFRNGVPETRLGMVKVGWLNKILPGTPGIAPFLSIHGTGVFSDPITRVQYTIIAAEGQVYACRANNAPTVLPLPAGVTIDSAVTFTQCFDVLVMFRGADQPALVMTRFLDGFALPVPSGLDPVISGEIEAGTVYAVSVASVVYNSVTIAAGDQFTGVPSIVTFAPSAGAVVTPVGGAVTLPNAERGLSAANRLFVMHGADLVSASDLLDYTRHTIFNDFRINQGSADRLVTIELFGNSTILCLKENSVFRVDNVFGDLSQTRLSSVTQRYGCVAAKSAVDVGTDFLWLSQSGVASLNLTQQGEIQAGSNDRPPMFSDAIQPLIDRINWNFASGAVMKFHDNKLYLAVPLDDAVVIDESLVAPGADYRNGFLYLSPDVGPSYYLKRGANEARISDFGSSTDDYLTDGNVSFATTPIFFQAGAALNKDITGDIQRRTVGANNAILVYDFLNGQWSGLDTFRDVGIKDMFTQLYNGRQRLFVTSTSGLTFLYEEAFEEELMNPYSDLTVTSSTTLPETGDTIRINSGQLVTASRAYSTNDAGGRWGVAMGRGLQNLFVDENGLGYGANASWARPSTRAAYIEGGVRIISTNGLIPTITKTGSVWWTQLDYTTTPVLSTFITRGYLQSDPAALKRSVSAGLQLQTFNPTLTVALINEGVGEETTLVSAERRDRTVFDKPFDAAPYAVSNADDNFMARYRQDYSIVYGADFTGFQCRSGVQLGVHQEMRRTFHTGTAARAPQIKITNTTGRIRVLAGGLASVGGQRRKGAVL